MKRTGGALALLKQHGIWGLGLGDGCRCTNFTVLGVSVDISCHKSEHCVRVIGWSHGSIAGDRRDASELESVAREVLVQLGEDVAYGYRVRFCEYRHDHAGGHWEF